MKTLESPTTDPDKVERAEAVNALMLATLLAPFQPTPSPDRTRRLAEWAFAAGVETRSDAAAARKHFATAGAGFDTHWHGGNRSALLAVQRGRSHFLAGNLPKAVVAFRAGLRETPCDLDLLRGLAECRAAIPYPTPARAEERLRPDPPSGWRHRVGEWDAFRLAALSAALAVIGLARRLTARDGWAIPVAAVGGVGALVCLVAALEFGAEAAAEVERPTLVVTAEVYLRKGNGLSHQPRIDATVPRGTELAERTRRGDWVQVEVAGGAVGWLPESAVVAVE